MKTVKIQLQQCSPPILLFSHSQPYLLLLVFREFAVLIILLGKGGGLSHLEPITSLLLGRIIAQTALGHLNLLCPYFIATKTPSLSATLCWSRTFGIDNNKSLLDLHFLLKLLLNTQPVRLFIDYDIDIVY